MLLELDPGRLGFNSWVPLGLDGAHAGTWAAPPDDNAGGDHDDSDDDDNDGDGGDLWPMGMTCDDPCWLRVIWDD